MRLAQTDSGSAENSAQVRGEDGPGASGDSSAVVSSTLKRLNGIVVEHDKVVPDEQPAPLFGC